MKTVPCTHCGRNFRPSNLARHVKAKHLPKEKRTPYGAKFQAPPNPIRLGKVRDRRYDEVFPRGEGKYRYRIYRLRAGDLEILGAAPDPGGMGQALVDLHAEGEFVGDDSVGVLDTAEDPGHWVVSPFTLGRKRTDDD